MFLSYNQRGKKGGIESGSRRGWGLVGIEDRGKKEKPIGDFDVSKSLLFWSSLLLLLPQERVPTYLPNSKDERSPTELFLSLPNQT
jgi:hypothetical protein